jgi:hypothetical protein
MLRVLSLLAAFAITLSLTLAQAAAQKDEPKKDDAPKPPAGWKEHSPRDGTYAVWIPEKTMRQSERERTSTVSGQKLKFNVLSVDVAGGPNYVVEEVIITPALVNKFKAGELADLFRDVVVADVGGKVTEDTDVKSGMVEGKEYRIEGKSITKARVFVSGNRVLVLRVTGKKEQVDGEGAKTFLDSGKLTAGAAAVARPRLFGGGNDPEFKDAAPEGGLLVGFDIGLGKVGERDMIRAIKPIYRTGDKESPGEQYGTQTTKVVTVKAKDGYAVGGMTVKHGGGFDGMSVIFMKVVDGKLDPKDSYESDFVGSDEKKPPTKVIGSGNTVIGVVGKINDKDMTGMGLLYKGQVFEPKKKP